MRSMLRIASFAALLLGSVHAVRAATPGAHPLSSWSGAIPASENRAAAGAATVPLSVEPHSALSSWSGRIPVDVLGAGNRADAPTTGHDSSLLSSWSGVIVASAGSLGAGGLGP